MQPLSHRTGWSRSAMAGIFVTAGALSLAACSSTSSVSSATRGSSPTGTTATAGSTAPSGPATAASSPASSGSSAGSAQAASATSVFPAVRHATDLAVEPVIAAGTEPAPTSLHSRDLVVGTGATATTASTVQVRYVGVNYATGKVFDASWTDPGGPTATFALTGTVPGFGQGIAGMKVGGRREIVIPPGLGYGSSGNGPVGPNETLVFVVDLLAVK